MTQPAPVNVWPQLTGPQRKAMEATYQLWASTLARTPKELGCGLATCRRLATMGLLGEVTTRGATVRSTRYTFKPTAKGAQVYALFGGGAP